MKDAMNLKKITTAAATLITALTLTSCADIVEGIETALDTNLTDTLSVGQDAGLDVDIAGAQESLNYLFVDDNPRPATPYYRDAFGPAWTDDNNDPTYGNNGCGTRDDILARDLEDVTYADSKECTVATGVLEEDPYTGRTIDFRRGTTTSRLVQIEHIVALKNAWESGAWQWSEQERIDYANDSTLLIAVDGPENASKGDKAADEWLVPNNPDFRCAYAALQVSIKDSYGLTVTSAEKDALSDTLQRCA